MTGGQVTQRVVRAGVPQGSVLDPLLWNLAYDEVLETHPVSGCSVIGYADDTLVVATGGSVEQVTVRANMQTAAVIHRIARLGLKVATDKTEAILFHGRRKPSRFPTVRVGDAHIEVGRTLRYLGIMFDSRLNFGGQFEYVAAKASKVASALGRLMPNLRGPSEIKRILYANTVMAVIMYGALV